MINVFKINLFVLVTLSLFCLIGCKTNDINIKRIVVSYGPTYYKSIELGDDGIILYASNDLDNDELPNGTFTSFYRGSFNDSLFFRVTKKLIDSDFFEMKEDSTYVNNLSIKSKYSIIVDYNNKSKRVIGDDFPKSFKKFLSYLFSLREKVELKKYESRYRFDTSEDVYQTLPIPINVED